MILTVTLNAASDVSYEVDTLDPGASHRVRTVHSRAGGKGINVGRILRSFGHDVVVTGLVGGATGETIRADLRDAGVPDALQPIAAESRRTVSVVSRESGEATLFNEPGPVVTEEEWGRFLGAFAASCSGARVVVLSGSLPVGVPADAYAVLVRSARATGAATIVDADADGLRLAVAARPDVVKPNGPELRTVTGIEDRDQAMAWLLEHGAGAVIATFGADGLMASTAKGSWRGWLKGAIQSVNPTGAGDACVAAVAAGLEAGRSWPATLADAVAWSAASVLAPIAGVVPGDALAAVRPLVRVEELDAARVSG